ncbi:UNVERIFIED_CONTAM: hypothetical protein FKN15_019826 [Acipenser sinensis]
MVQARDVKCSVQAHPKHVRETAVAVEDEVCHGSGTVEGVLLKAAVAIRVQRCWLVLICSDAEVDAAVHSEVVLLKVPGVPGDRLVFAPTGPLDRDYDDVRRFTDAAVAGMKRALKAGMQSPLLVCPAHSTFKESTLVSVLGALHALYVVSADREQERNIQGLSESDRVGNKTPVA